MSSQFGANLREMSEDDKWAKNQNRDGFNEKAEETNEERVASDDSKENQGKGDEDREETKFEKTSPDHDLDSGAAKGIETDQPAKEVEETEVKWSRDRGIDDKEAHGQTTPEFNEKSHGENENEGDEHEDREEEGKEDQGHDEPSPAPRPKGLGMDGGTSAGMAGAQSESQRNAPTHSEDEIKAWSIEENTAMQSQYAEERSEMEGQHQEALDNQWDLLSEKQEKEREEVITSMQAEQESELNSFDNDFNDSWAEQTERVNEAYEKGQIPEPKMGHGEEQVQEKKNDGHEL